jgi:hypothetical protein
VVTKIEVSKMEEYKIKSEQKPSNYQAKDKPQSTIEYRLGPDGFVYEKKVTSQEFDKRYQMR